MLGGVIARADHGLYVNFVFFCDTLESFEEGGMLSAFPGAGAEKLAADIDRWIDNAYETASKESDFREGLTLLVGCGIGRLIFDVTSKKKRDNWRCEFIGASDLVTLSWLPNFKTLSLWRLLDGQDRLGCLGVQLYNFNGLLNVVGWARSHTGLEETPIIEGHLVFRNPVPMKFAWDRMNDRVALSLMSELHNI